MIYILSSEGNEALGRAIARKPLLAFDYDGTLAPITQRYNDTSTPQAIVRSLRTLSELAKVIIITGRAVADVSPRLGFEPHAIIGNHGAEGLPMAHAARYAALVSAWRARIEAHFGEALRSADVILEDKGSSLSLHYRQARDAIAAQDLIAHACSLLTPPARISGGKCVVNVIPLDAPNKADALLATALAEHADSAIFVGDDQNDEVVFEHAPAHWLTVRVGRSSASLARYYLERQDEMECFIKTVLHHWRASHQTAT